MLYQKRNHLMKGKFLLAAFFILGCFQISFAQETWSLEKCIDYAQANSLAIKTAKYTVVDAQLSEKQARLQRMPFVSGRGSFGQQFGRTIDPTTNTFRNQKIGFSSWGIDANITLFDGGRIHNQVKQGEIDVKAARMNAEVQTNDLGLNIANTYLQILNAQEQLANAEIRLNLSTKQLDRTDKLINAGTLPANDRLDILAQIARNEQQIIQAQNAVEINYLGLYQLLELEIGKEFIIEEPEMVIPGNDGLDAIEFKNVYNTALTTQPQIKLDELRLQSAEIGVNLAKANMYPSLALFGGLSSNWSSAAKSFDADAATFDFGNGTPVSVNGIPASLAQLELTNDPFNNIGYLDQLDQNFGQNFGVSLNVPIYSRGTNKINVERAELAILNAGLSSQQSRQALKTEVQTAIANARAAKQTLAAGQKTVAANTRAYENSQKRFDLGSINTFDLTTAKNNLDISEVDVVVAKYEYLFRLKIVDFYMGKALKL
ncbi:MAG: outer membrane protein [Paraglaciecola sp.]|jgi:outer membrane protein